MKRHIACILALTAAPVLPLLPRSATAAIGVPAPAPRSLLLLPADLPAGYVADAALENADATARTAAYAPIVAAEAFTGYRTRTTAIAHDVALLRTRADVALYLAHEAATLDRAHNAARLTLAGRYGDSGTLAYQERGTRGQDWVMATFADGRYVTTVGVYDAAGEESAIERAQGLAAAVDRRLRPAGRLAGPSHVVGAIGAGPLVRLLALATMNRSGRPGDTFRPRGVVYWRALWRVGRVHGGVRETVRVRVWQGKWTLYANSLTDLPFAGDNAVGSQLRLGASPGPCRIAVTVTIDRHTVAATHTFYVTPARPGHGSARHK